MGFIAQPKLNGSCGVLFIGDNKAKLMNRHKAQFARLHKIPTEELIALQKEKGWTVLVGEYMNKSQRGVDRKIFNEKFVIFDIMVHNGEHMIGSSFAERQLLLDTLYPKKSYDNWIDKISANIFRVKNIDHDIEKAWKKIIEVEMYEGMVFKKPTGKLDIGVREVNNTLWQSKIRKPTKNYAY
jgi:hypothetical protein